MFLNDLSSRPDIAHLCLMKEGLSHWLSVCFKTKARRVVVTRVKKETTFRASPLKHTLADTMGHVLLYSHNLAEPPPPPPASEITTGQTTAGFHRSRAIPEAKALQGTACRPFQYLQASCAETSWLSRCLSGMQSGLHSDRKTNRQLLSSALWEKRKGQARCINNDSCHSTNTLDQKKSHYSRTHPPSLLDRWVILTFPWRTPCTSRNHYFPERDSLDTLNDYNPHKCCSWEPNGPGSPGTGHRSDHCSAGCPFWHLSVLSPVAHSSVACQDPKGEAQVGLGF